MLDLGDQHAQRDIDHLGAPDDAVAQEPMIRGIAVDGREKRPFLAATREVGR
jgi:hypothetical protein